MEEGSVSEPITERGDPRDRTHNQRELFDASRTIAMTCPVCGATRAPGEEKAPACADDRDREINRHQRRRIGCLNAYDPAHQPIPY